MEQVLEWLNANLPAEGPVEYRLTGTLSLLLVVLYGVYRAVRYTFSIDKAKLEESFSDLTKLLLFELRLPLEHTEVQDSFGITYTYPDNRSTGKLSEALRTKTGFILGWNSHPQSHRSYAQLVIINEKLKKDFFTLAYFNRREMLAIFAAYNKVRDRYKNMYRDELNAAAAKELKALKEKHGT